MGDLLQDGNFTPNNLVSFVVGILGKHFLLEFMLLENFDGICLACKSIFAEFDFSEGSSADELLDEILVDLHVPVGGA